MVNTQEPIECYTTDFGSAYVYPLPNSVPIFNMTTTPQTPIAGKNITFNFTNVLKDKLTTEYKIDIVFRSTPTSYKYSQKICIGNNTFCPIPAGKKYEIIVEITMPEDIDIPSLSIYPYIFYKIDNNSYNGLGCACYTVYSAMYCLDWPA
ncbi:2556_t:CDS:1 [Racocetra persica]|uniref:2556_t:CDS:1 n=1 Tax=Racocetra persica TaxID=160502 RepID=A0ACA9NQ77_9GLOM|nr:2556_t:CDS:1 [Racocetra persica]